jgi:anti-anti-sigma factor
MAVANGEAGGDAAVEVAVDGANVNVTLHEELDMSSAPAIGAEVIQHVQAAAAQPTVTLDLADVAFVDSSGLRMLLEVRAATEAAQGALRCINAQPNVVRTISMVGLQQALGLD